MSFQAMAWALRQDLPCVDKMVLLTLCDHMNHESQRCDPSVSRIAKAAGLGETATKSSIKRLHDDGFIQIVHRTREDGGQTSNAYRILMSASRETTGGPFSGDEAPRREATPNLESEPGKEPEGYAAAAARHPVLDQNGVPYAFAGKIIRLNQQDYENWEQAYNRIDDFRAALQARDDWLATEASPMQREKWFISTSNWLKSENAKEREIAEQERMGGSIGL